MRVNVYEEEITDGVTIEKRISSDTGFEFWAVRFWLKSPKDLGDTQIDDNRSSVTFFSGDLNELLHLFEIAVSRIRNG